MHQPRTHQQGLPPPQQLRQHSRQHQPLLYQPRSASTTYPQAIPSLNAGSFVATRPLNAGPASTQQLPGYHPASPAQGQAPIKQQPVDHSYPGPQPTLYSTHSSGGGNHPPDQGDNMAVQAMNSRQMYPSIGSYHPSQTAPTSLHSPQHAPQPRGIYQQGFALPQHLYGYPQYTLPPQSNYTHAPPSHAYPAVSSASSGMLLSHQPPPPLMHHQSSNHSQGPIMNTSPRAKVESSPIEQSHELSMGVGTPLNAHSVGALISGPPAGSRPDPSTAAPGPIPATTPLVVRQDQNGVQWIAFEYSRDRVKMEYQIRCDVESVDTASLSDEFKSANCVYPRACSNKDQYKGNRLHYESECNAVGWALAELNPMLREKRGLIQRAVDSWRNSNSDSKLRSRRVRRMAKINNRKQQMSNTPGPPVSASQMPNNVHTGAVRPSHPGVAAGQLHHQHPALDGMGPHNGDDVSGMFHQM